MSCGWHGDAEPVLIERQRNHHRVADGQRLGQAAAEGGPVADAKIKEINKLLPPGIQARTLLSRTDLVDVSSTDGAVTLDGVRTNVRISLEYLSAWVGGAGAVAIGAAF